MWMTMTLQRLTHIHQLHNKDVKYQMTNDEKVTPWISLAGILETKTCTLNIDLIISVIGILISYDNVTKELGRQFRKNGTLKRVEQANDQVLHQFQVNPL